MDCVSITVKAKQVGNSIALFVPADVCDDLGININTEIVAQISKKKQRPDLFGILKGKKLEFTEEDRLNVRY